jgi:hypothetical protein
MDVAGREMKKFLGEDSWKLVTLEEKKGMGGLVNVG